MQSRFSTLFNVAAFNMAAFNMVASLPFRRVATCFKQQSEQRPEQRSQQQPIQRSKQQIPSLLVCVPAILAGLMLPAQAQSAMDSVSDSAVETVTVCEYDPSTGLMSPLVSTSSLETDASITIRATQGDTVFTYEKPFSIVLIADSEAETALPRREGSGLNPDLAVTRSLTMRGLDLAVARQLMIDQPSYYAQLLGVSEQGLGDRTFAEIDQTLACREETGETPADNTSETPADNTSEMPADNVSADTLESFSDGNYRMTSAEFPLRIVRDDELLAAGGYVFTFRKVSDRVTGTFNRVDGQTQACFSGTVSGNAISGETYLPSRPADPLMRGDGGQWYLDELGVLMLGDRASGSGRFVNSVMQVDGLSRINAGTQVPPENCA